jgi:two-component system cell cycle response regulator DivK
MGASQSKILIIDDDARNIFALGAVLKSKGFSIVTAGSAAEGLDILGKEKVSVVLLDMMMPEIDGYQAIGLIRELGENIPIIAVTAQAMVGDRERCLAAGANAYVSKPVDVDELMALLNGYQQLR